MADFRNEAYTNFSLPANRQAMEAALAKTHAEFGREYELRIGGENFRTAEKLRSVNPSRPAEIVGVHQKATPDMASAAIEAAYSYFPEWSVTDTGTRIGALRRAAQILRRR